MLAAVIPIAVPTALFDDELDPVDVSVGGCCCDGGGETGELVEFGDGDGDGDGGVLNGNG